MNSWIQNTLKNNRILGCFEHNGRKLTKDEARKILRYALKKGYQYSSEITDEDVNNALYFFRKYNSK